MIRVVIENLLLFLLPTLVYVVWIVVTRRLAANEEGESPGAARILDDAPLLWLFATGAILVVVTLIAFGSTSGGKPGQHYEPPSMRDGHIEPGRLQ